MEQVSSLPRLAVFVDADNVPLRALAGVRDAVDGAGQVRCCRIYGNLPKRGRPTWAEAARKAGLPVPHFTHVVGPNAADSVMMLDAMELALTLPLSGICLMSSDGDFAYVAVRLRALGRAVHVIGQPNAARCLRQAACSFHPIPPLPAQIIH